MLMAGAPVKPGVRAAGQVYQRKGGALSGSRRAAA